MVSMFLLLLEVLFIALGSFRACQLIDRWIDRWIAQRRPDAVQDDCAFGIKLNFGDITLSYWFPDRKACDDFMVGFMEGAEQLLMHYQRLGLADPDAWVDYTRAPPHE